MVYKLKEIRKRKGLTQKKLSEMSGINRVTIAKYETDINEPSLRNAVILANVLGEKIEEFIEEG